MVKLEGKPFNLNIIQVYLPTTSPEDEEVDTIYDTIENIAKPSKNNEVNVIIGEMNAKVGKEKEGKIAGSYGLGKCNEEEKN